MEKTDRAGRKNAKGKGVKMATEKLQFPFLSEQLIEKSTLELIQKYESHIGEKLKPLIC